MLLSERCSPPPLRSTGRDAERWTLDANPSSLPPIFLLPTADSFDFDRPHLAQNYTVCDLVEPSRLAEHVHHSPQYASNHTLTSNRQQALIASSPTFSFTTSPSPDRYSPLSPAFTFPSTAPFEESPYCKTPPPARRYVASLPGVPEVSPPGPSLLLAGHTRGSPTRQPPSAKNRLLRPAASFDSSRLLSRLPSSTATKRPLRPCASFEDPRGHHPPARRQARSFDSSYTDVTSAMKFLGPALQPRSQTGSPTSSFIPYQASALGAEVHIGTELQGMIRKASNSQGADFELVRWSQ